MANNEYTLSHQEVVKAIIIDQHIHEGLWTLNINFNVEASHAPRVHDPSLTVTIKGVGIMRAPPTDPFAVDAALINPTPTPRVEETAQIAAQANSANSDHVPDGSMQFCRDVYRSIAVQSAVKPRSKTS
jgi:hypothetical protein